MPEIIPIGGGKGGAGKSFIAANLGALIAKKGHQVVLVDLDLGASNLHTFLGIKNTSGGLNLFMTKQVQQLAQVVVPTHHANLSFVNSVNCSMQIANLYHAQKVKLINALKGLSFDYIILDLGAGTHFNTLDFFLTSNKSILVCTPEPTAIENAFRFIKAVYLRKLKQIIHLNAFHKVIKKAVLDEGHDELGSADIIDLVLKYDPDHEMLLRESISHFHFKFILNQFRKHMGTGLGEKIEIVCNRHFYSKFHFLGYVQFDDRVFESVLRKSLFTLSYPDSSASASLEQIATQLTGHRTTAVNLTEAS
ncbi:MAG: P-loop NTPase [Desulfatitalea sp.]|nr:P-loop NTPase [Desulfatitalea sp.]NNJ98851.1 P-loop NTPase [Desulfatitalea sp.]